ncbi:MAG: hypothetical protein M3N14_06310, partial [Bacteroidota bacterium]|nr:hypothetical protein [Bacteroidota bacterium]
MKQNYVCSKSVTRCPTIEHVGNQNDMNISVSKNVPKSTHRNTLLFLRFGVKNGFRPKNKSLQSFDLQAFVCFDIEFSGELGIRTP